MIQTHICYLVATKTALLEGAINGSFERVRLLQEPNKDAYLWTDYISKALKFGNKATAKIYIDMLVRDGEGEEEDFWVMPLKVSYEW